MRQDELVGRTIAGRFTIKRFLGEGGMASVWVADQDGEPREVALKIMNAELNADRSFVKRFQREAQAASRVQHPNSVKIVDYGVTEDGISYMAMELLVGDDLYVLLERNGALSQRRAARILAEVCEVLTIAHDLGIVHRDLKPENVMVVADASTRSGERVKVLDFGIAKLLVSDPAEKKAGMDRAEPASAVTRAGAFIGTPQYMSPEQCGLDAVDTRADLYTCGVLLFQLITGRVPFEGESPLHTAMLHLHKEAPKPSTFAPKIDPRLEAIILKALAKRPADRHQTALHLGGSLRRIEPELADIPVAAGPVSKRSTSTFQAPPAHGRAADLLDFDPLPPLPTPVPRPPLDPRMEFERTLAIEDGVPPAIRVQSEPPMSSSPPARIRMSPVFTGHVDEASLRAPPARPPTGLRVDPLARTAFDDGSLAPRPAISEKTLESSEPGAPRPAAITQSSEVAPPAAPAAPAPMAFQAAAMPAPLAPAPLAPAPLAGPPHATIPPAASRLAGARGLVLGFAGGVVLMVILALVYFFTQRH